MVNGNAGVAMQGLSSKVVVGLLADILATRVLETDNAKEGWLTFGVAVNVHRPVIRDMARRLSLRDDEGFNDAWAKAIWPAVVAQAEDLVSSRCRAMACAAPWSLRTYRAR